MIRRGIGVWQTARDEPGIGTARCYPASRVRLVETCRGDAQQGISGTQSSKDEAAFGIGDGFSLWILLEEDIRARNGVTNVVGNLSLDHRVGRSQALLRQRDGIGLLQA